MSTPVIAYWPFRALVQPHKFLLEYLEVKYEAKGYTDREEWNKDKAEFLKTDALANIPYYKDGDKVVFESTAIIVYLVNKYNRPDLNGSTLEEQVLVQQAIGVLDDVRKNSWKLFWSPKEEFAAKGLEQYREVTTPYKNKLEFLLQGKKFLAGNNISVADFFLYEFTDFGRLFDQTFLDNFPNLKTHHQNFREIPQIKNYLASDKFQERPFFGDSTGANWG